MGFKKTVEINGEEKEIELQGTSSSSNNIAPPVSAMEMHGRRRIYTSETEINAGNVVKVLNKALETHRRNRSEIEYLQKYLRGIQPILGRTKKVNGDICCNRTVVNIASQIITFKTANFAGESIQYVSRGNNRDVPGMVEQLNSMMLSEGKPSKDMMLAQDMLTCGVGYRLVLNDKALAYANASRDGDLYDEAPFEIYTLDPRNTCVVRTNNVKQRVAMGANYVYLNESGSKVRYTVYTDNETFTIDGNAITADKLVSVKRHNFGIVPLIEYPCNPICMGAFEGVLPLLDAYNLMTSNRLDGIEQFIQALLVFEGVDVTRETLLKLRDLGAIMVPPATDGRTGRVYYLNEQLDQVQTQVLVDNLYDRILQIVGMPYQGNANTSDSSNNGAMVIKSGQWDAQARILETQGMWKAADTEMLKVVFRICHDSGALDGLKVSDVEPKFGIHNYEDRLVKTQSFTTLISAGCPPLQAFTLSGVSKDPEADAMAYEAYQEAQTDNLMINHTDNMDGAYDTDDTETDVKNDV